MMQNLDRLYIGKIDPVRNPDGTIPQRLPSALLKYCELDTMAMVMLYEAWREL